MNKTLFLIAVICLPAAACKKNKEKTAENTHVYLAGFYSNGTTAAPAYWKDSVRFMLDRPGDDLEGNATGICIAGNDIHITGYYRNVADNYVGCYWKNGVRTDLQGLVNTQTNGIALAGNDVYIVGYTVNASNRSLPCYWKNGVRTELSRIDATKSGLATCIFVLGTDVYVGGYCFNSSNIRIACYWKNGERTNMPAGAESYGMGIFVTGTTVYLCGSHRESTTVHTPCIWKNGLRTDLSRLSADYQGMANTIGMLNDTVYVAGYNTNSSSAVVPCYWKNTQRTDLDPDDGMVNAVFISGNDVYLGGLANRNACYWKNGVRKNVANRLSTVQSVFITIQ